MNQEQFKAKLLDLANKIGVELDVEQLNKYYKYMQLLIEWNKKINLTAIIEPDDIILKHFVDSLTILKYMQKNAKLIDVGTGAGFPGIPLSIAENNINITLLDSLNKRINFLNEVINECELKNIETIHARVEEFGRNKKYREKYDITTSRAVASLNVLTEYMLPLTKVGGICICMKGSNTEDEINQSQKAISILGGKIEKVDEFELPDTDIKRKIIIIRKIKQTPAQYPRKPGTPSKEPL